MKFDLTLTGNLADALGKGAAAATRSAAALSQYSDGAAAASTKTQKLAGNQESLVSAFLKAEIVKAAVMKTWGAVQAMAAASADAGDMKRSLSAMLQNEQAAENTYAVLANIGNRVAISQSEIMKTASALETAGMRNGDMLVKAVEAVGTAEAARKGAGVAIQGILERSASSRYFSVSRQEIRAAGLTFESLAKSISQQTGMGVADAAAALSAGRVPLTQGLDALNATVKDRLGKLAGQKFQTVTFQMQRMKDGFGRLFESFDGGPVGKVMQHIADLFDVTTANGHSMKAFLDGAFATFSDTAEKVFPYVSAAMRTLKNLALIFYYEGIRPLAWALEDAFGVGSITTFSAAMVKVTGQVRGGFQVVHSAIDKVAAVSKFLGDNAWPALASASVILFAAYAPLVPVIWGGAAALAATAGAAVIAAAPVLAVAAAVGAIVAMAQYAIKTLPELWEFFDGGQIVQGLVNGIVDGIDKFVGAVKKMATAGLDAFRGIFQIRSPSKVMALQGGHIVGGLAQGIDRAAPKAADALSTSLTPADAPAVSPSLLQNTRGAGGGGTTNTGSTVTFAPGSIVINAGNAGAGAELAGMLPTIFADVFEQMGVSLGVSA